ncbi:hypothetical protein TNCV_4267781 [Trichonephila clavipes]|nr:hypothetical protein TNCV_4267781 [Trichonephila clavipes]
MADGNLGLLKVRIKFLVGKRDESFFIVILLTWVTPWSESPSKISVSEEDKRSGSEMTPRHEFNDLRMRIPCDFQRTSLAGLALDSATSSGLGRAPALQCRTPSRHHLELQDRRDYTPADRAARNMLVRLSRAPVLSGGLRRKTQLFSGTLYMAASSKTPPH